MDDFNTELEVETDSRLDTAVDALRELTLAVQDFRQRFANFADINVTDALALSHLAAGAPLTSGELAQRVGLASSGATVLVDRLVKAGLASRSARPGDRRTVYVSLTEKAYNALNLSTRWTKQAVLDLGEEHLDEVARLLNELSVALGRRAREFDQATSGSSNRGSLGGPPSGPPTGPARWNPPSR